MNQNVTHPKASLGVPPSPHNSWGQVRQPPGVSQEDGAETVHSLELQVCILFSGCLAFRQPCFLYTGGSLGLTGQVGMFLSHGGSLVRVLLPTLNQWKGWRTLANSVTIVKFCAGKGLEQGIGTHLEEVDWAKGVQNWPEVTWEYWLQAPCPSCQTQRLLSLEVAMQTDLLQPQTRVDTEKLKWARIIYSLEAGQEYSLGAGGGQTVAGCVLRVREPTPNECWERTCYKNFVN